MASLTAGQVTLTFVHALRLLCVDPELCRESVAATGCLRELLRVYEECGGDEGDGGDGGIGHRGDESMGRDGDESIDHNGDEQSIDHNGDEPSISHNSDIQSIDHNSDIQSIDHNSDIQSISHNSDIQSIDHNNDEPSVNHNHDMASPNSVKGTPASNTLHHHTTPTPLNHHSTKIQAVQRLVQKILDTTDELLLVISTYTQILDFFCTLCKDHHWDFFRLDGSTDIAQRQTMVNSFNARFTSKRLFLLSARAGGVGLNITGASRVILLEPAWNPAIDAQSIARSWRFGQQRPVFVYRFFLSGTIEEVILQRQLLKKDIADVAVDHSSVGEGKLAKEELREIFKLKDIPCQTYLLMNGKKTKRESGDLEPQAEDAVWKEYRGCESIRDDPLLKELVKESRTG